MITEQKLVLALINALQYTAHPQADSLFTEQKRGLSDSYSTHMDFLFLNEQVNIFQANTSSFIYMDFIILYLFIDFNMESKP